MSGRGGEKSREQQLKGIAAAPGIAIGKVYKLSSSALNVESPERRTITPEEINPAFISYIFFCMEEFFDN